MRTSIRGNVVKENSSIQVCHQFLCCKLGGGGALMDPNHRAHPGGGQWWQLQTYCWHKPDKAQAQKQQPELKCKESPGHGAENWTGKLSWAEQERRPNTQKQLDGDPNRWPMGMAASHGHVREGYTQTLQPERQAQADRSAESSIHTSPTRVKEKEQHHTAPWSEDLTISSWKRPGAYTNRHSHPTHRQRWRAPHSRGARTWPKAPVCRLTRTNECVSEVI